MRKPLDLLLKVLAETGILEIIEDSEDPIKIKANDLVTEEVVVRCIRQNEIEDTLLSNFAAIGLPSAWKPTLSYLQAANGYKALRALLEFALGKLRGPDEDVVELFKSVVFPKPRLKKRLLAFGFLGGLLKTRYGDDPKLVDDFITSLDQIST